MTDPTDQVAVYSGGNHLRFGGYSVGWKRGIDVAAASTALILLLPLLVLIYLGVRLDGGPGLFRHRRLGKNAKEFGCLKFRTMVLDADAALSKHLAEDENARTEWEATQKLRLDPRVTPLGRLLRKSSLDELPQLFNVLSGEMSMVGPRPIVRAEVPRYGEAASRYFAVRPGLTGLWQVSGRNDVSYAQRVEMDIEYIASISFKSDAALVLRTVGVLLGRRGAY